MTPIKKVFKNGAYTETWYKLKDAYHREDGPALVCEFEDGDHIEEWFYEGKNHRYGGPAYQCYIKNNSAAQVYQVYWIHGKNATGLVNKWLSERDYIWETMADIEKWELEMFMRSLG